MIAGLNTCIGRDNYVPFFRTMVLIFFMQIMHIVVQIVLVVDIYKGGPASVRADAWFDANASVAVVAVLIFFICFDGVSVSLIGQLLYFHLMLQRENLTTYAYIVRESSRRRDKIRAYQELQAKRMTQITRARQEGNTSFALQLQLGGACRAIGCSYCDPIQPPPQLQKDAGMGRNDSMTSSAAENGGQTPSPDPEAGRAAADAPFSSALTQQDESQPANVEGADEAKSNGGGNSAESAATGAGSVPKLQRSSSTEEGSVQFNDDTGTTSRATSIAVGIAPDVAGDVGSPGSVSSPASSQQRLSATDGR